MDSANTNLWDNKKGTGASTVTYEYGGKMSVRTSGKLSNNNEGFSHYSGSGMNKVFFGAATSIFKINNITLGSGNNYTLSYGGQKYLQGADCNYSFEEMKVYVSNDAQKWVPVTMAFPADADIDGDWNLATGNFTLPEGTSTLSIAFVCTASSAYSIDDVLLQVSDKAGQAVDFSTGVAIDGTTPGSGGGNTGGDTAGKPATLQKVTIAEFLAAAEDDTWYELTGEIINIAKEDYGNFTIKDATDEVYIYGMTSKWVGSNDKSFSQIGLKVGDTVTLGTKRGSYNGTPQGGGNPVPAYYISHVAGEGSGNQGGSNDGDDNGDDDNTGNVTPVGGNSDDFAALTSSRYYEASLTTPNGWVLNNCQVHTYGTANSNDTFAYVPEGNKAVCMNGKTAAAGKVTSPVIAGGCEALSFNYCYPFSESNGVSIKVEILQNDAVVKSFDVVNKTAAKYEVCSHTEQIGVTGNFTIRFSNNSPSNNSSSNKDRYSIWNITWTSKAE